MQRAALLTFCLPQTGEWDKGNGSLMRCLPMVFMDCTSAEVRAVSAITHATDACMDACEKMIRYAARLMREGTPAGESAGEPGGSSGYVWDTYNAAIWCLEHTESYKECVLAAVNLGDDTDTTACVAGGLAGILYGREAIPSEWLAALRGKDVIEACLFE
ncbi:ADP-ribosylglycohydrolase family protein [Slackia isoflavoniconvertens]|uniref:ADP-ribosylglycohydrolase family protein n=1 Tax=Slackia isoflavoniconvertens TaxID=572010 RepID=UPI002E768B2B|nr:ADP-ribosylglycohydrolase family protein [Slackia isoflavoniconvertens]